MRSQKHGLKALVLGIVVVLGALATAAGAQGQTHTELLAAHADHNKTGGVLNPSPLTNGGTLGKFSVNLGEITLSVPLAATLNGTGILLVQGRSIEIRCTGVTISATINNNTDASGEATFTGCKKFDHKTLNEMTVCVLKTLETITAKFLALPILHGGELFVLFEPFNLEGTTFTTIGVKPNLGCTLPLNSPVTGSVVALVEQLEGTALGLLFSPGIQLLHTASLGVGGFTGFLTGEVTVKASGVHTGQKLGVH